VPDNLHNQIITAYERIVQPHMASGDKKAAARGIQALVNRYGTAAVETALEDLVLQYELNGH
jgi:hypothetical protein